ncbi:MAG: hypothetical protein ACODAG_10800 [Myxococcota bacterium]
MTRETLHQLVEDLDERDFPTADRVLRALRDSRADLDPFQVLDTAPEVDEPETPEERAAVEEALQEIREGKPGLTTEELERELGLV